jgi:micrococcal nuclease
VNRLLTVSLFDALSPSARPDRCGRHLVIVAALLMATAGAAAQAPALVGTSFDATVVRIADGDTVEVLRAGERQPLRVRLEGVDAPELGEAFSRDAQLFLRRLMLDKRVRVSGRDVDRYGRLVARLVIAGQDASFELLAAGLACQRFATDATLAAAESRARSGGVGFWAATATKPQCVARSRGASAGTPPAPRAPAAAPAVQVRANVATGVYHRPACPNFTCRNCTRVFASEAEARSAGFRPAGDCHP